MCSADLPTRRVAIPMIMPLEERQVYAASDAAWDDYCEACDYAAPAFFYVYREALADADAEAKRLLLEWAEEIDRRLALMRANAG